MRRGCTAVILLVCLVCSVSCGTTLPKTPSFDASRPESWETALTTHVYEGLLEVRETIDMTHLGFPVSEEDLRRVFSTLLASKADLFFVSQEYTLKKEGEALVYMRPAYRYTGQELLLAKEDYEARLSHILTPITPRWSQLEVVLYLHDYIITHFSYDETHAVHNPYVMLTQGTGVCQAYALLFQALCQRAGVECEVVLCFPKHHEWNQVKLGEDWYHIDLTWDETELPYLGRVPHTYCLVDDATLRARRADARADWQDAYVWDAPHPAEDSTFANLPLDACFGTTSVGTGTLYFATPYEIWAVNVHTLSATPIFTYPQEEQGNPFVTLVTYHEEVYFNLSTRLWRISPSGDITPLGAPLTKAGERYYGIGVVDDTLICQTKK